MRAGESLPVDRREVLDEVRASMAGLGLCPADVPSTAHLVDDLGLDSLDWIDLAMHLEEKLSIAIREEALASVRTVQDVADRVHAALAEGRGAPA